MKIDLDTDKWLSNLCLLELSEVYMSRGNSAGFCRIPVGLDAVNFLGKIV